MTAEQKYDSLRTLEDHHSDSDTEVGDGDWEPEHQAPPRRRRKGVWATVKAYWWIVDTVLLVIILGLLVERIPASVWRKVGYKESHFLQFGADITGFAPKFSQQIKKFDPDERFAPANASAFWDKDTQDAWLSIVPKGLGYVHVHNTSQYSYLPHPLHDYPNKTVFTTSMTHQLHCLYTILDAYSTLYTAATALPPKSAEIEFPWHVTHCFDYIRQGIMCAGDVALEGAETTFPPDPETGERGGSDGWDARHVCRDYGQVVRYLEGVAADQEKWI
ncbi:hypothetical protein BCR34DRAFT_583415 [Clohesyomyces aquaticus]|uniref:Oxidase ustYa n=1 Tax=Clohesyomyces aquaticus TaxID=1231657 RepID=A0A1Y2A5S1_9PLEO|nr:hypothetical protein BCR34DRAFT_583415 [Clohesyomyces aquaticus]